MTNEEMFTWMIENDMALAMNIKAIAGGDPDKEEELLTLTRRAFERGMKYMTDSMRGM